MKMDSQLHTTLASLPVQSIKQRIAVLDQVYHITEDINERQKMLLVLDELKVELLKRGIND